MKSQPDEQKSPQAVPAASEDVEIKMLLRVIEQAVHSILVRDIYMRVLLTVQTLLIIFLIFK